MEGGRVPCTFAKEQRRRRDWSRAGVGKGDAAEKLPREWRREGEGFYLRKRGT